jgi:hypothetical protein
VIDVTRTKPSDSLFRIAGWCAYASGVTFIIAWIPLVTILAFRVKIPYLNDSAAIVQYFLALPITIALHRLVQAHAPVLSRVAMLSGIIGIFAVAVIQIVLLAGLLPSYTTYIILITTAFLMIGAWLVITGYLVRSTGKLPNSVLMSWLGAIYIGYPVWAFWLGRHLRHW